MEEVKDGLVKLSALTEIIDETPYSLKGEGELATLTFRPLKAGQTSLNITAQSVVVSRGENVLGESEELELTITRQ